MNAILADLLNLGSALKAHVVLSAAALGLGILIALPMIVWSARSRQVARISLGLAGLVQTIPALALLALFYPFLLSVSAILGGGIPALGFLPALLALGLYAVLPILRNGVTGLAQLDPAAREAADAMGMTATQKLRWVEAPLAAPFVMAGIRTAAVWTIGAATLSTTVGAQSLGDAIFTGLQTEDWALVLAGCIGSAALALVTDALLGLVERGLANRRRWMTWLGAAIAAAGIAWALLPGGAGTARPVLTVGAKGYTEQYILARLLGDKLTEAGFDVRYRQGLGSAVIFKALQRGDIDVYVDYSGTLWTNEMRRTDKAGRQQMIDDISGWMDRQGHGRLIGALGFENVYAFAMRSDEAKRLGIRNLEDLASKSRQLSMGTDLEFLNRPEWAAVKRAYPMHFRMKRRYNPTFMYKAVKSGAVDTITAFSSDGRIAAYDLTVLDDPEEAIPHYDAVVLASPRCMTNQKCVGAIRPLLGKIDVKTMRAANVLVSRDSDKQSPRQAAAWLAQQIDRR
ncbi:ABC transporter permease/substrate-binding protein [Novosphingobium sp. ZN18A2]|uniref:ABC transporter permease/substrate-binding protein n=1 Tax=Novosphingobium sp. ZN18A2 TaxID=3079861 RepID=UPI0030CDDFAC